MPIQRMSRRQAADILGVYAGSGEREIKLAYRKLAIKWHPDKNADDERATEVFQLIGAAYASLCEVHEIAPQFWTEEDLFYAAEEGDLAEIKSLIEAGVDILNTTDRWGFTAMHKAAQRGRHLIVKALLERTDAVHLCRARIQLGGSTPLLLAVEKGLEECHTPELLAVVDRSSNQTALQTAKANHARSIKYKGDGIAEKRVVDLLLYYAPDDGPAAGEGPLRNRDGFLRDLPPQ
ncbi:DnaJ domain-containing protein [Baffinella frigidus]|nr:DnaJ domain-containing protein [Cryptophyta sp. CCMP2293]